MKIKVDYKIGFDDGEIMSYFRKDDYLVVKIKAWNEALIKVTFSNVAGVADYGIGDISGLFEEDAHSPFKEKVIGEMYESVPKETPYRLYQFLNLDERPSLEIVAESVTISDKA